MATRVCHYFIGGLVKHLIRFAPPMSWSSSGYIIWHRVRKKPLHFHEPVNTHQRTVQLSIHIPVMPTFWCIACKVTDFLWLITLNPQGSLRSPNWPVYALLHQRICCLLSQIDPAWTHNFFIWSIFVMNRCCFIAKRDRGSTNSSSLALTMAVV